MKKGAIFDMDGLLLDTERLYHLELRETLRRFGLDGSPEFESAIAGTSGARALEVIHDFFPLADAQGFWDDWIGRTMRRLEREVPEKPGAHELPAFLRAHGVRTAVASSTELRLVRRYLRQTGLDELFDEVVSGQEARRGKPAPDVFLLAAERIGCAPEDCYVFEDSISGCRAGIAAGCATVMVIDLFQPTEELRSGCAGIFNSLLEARDAIERGSL